MLWIFISFISEEKFSCCIIIIYRCVILCISRILLERPFFTVIQRPPKDRNLICCMPKVFVSDVGVWQCIHFHALAIRWSSRNWYTILGMPPTIYGTRYCVNQNYSSHKCILCMNSSAKRIYIGGLLFYSCGMCILAMTRTQACVIIFSWCAGVMYSTLFTMPYLLVARYHSEGIVRIYILNELTLNFLLNVSIFSRFLIF